jgi:proline iminopeptidase
MDEKINKESDTAETGTIESSGFRLQYQIEGIGLPAIVVGSSLYYSRTFSQNLRKHLRFIFMDHRGFVPAPGPVDNSAFELNILIEDIEKVRQKLGLERIIIIGHSGHAFMALEYAKKYSEHVSHVVMIGVAPNFSASSNEAANQYLRDSVSPERKTVLEENLKHLSEEIVANPDRRFISYSIRNGARSWYDFRFDSSPMWEGVNVNMQMFDYVWGTVFHDIDITKGLNTFNKPVFLALGRYDFLVAPPSSWDSVRSNFKNLTVRVFEKSGHTPQYEEPILFDEELLRWLSPHP